VQSLLEAHAEATDFIPTRLTASCPSQSAPEEAEGPGARIGCYKLLQKIGEGGCGIVYMAEQEKPLRRRVALKVIKLGMDTRQVIARFEAERQALALMDHANIAKVLDAGATDTGRPYFVMDLVRGLKITEYCVQKDLATAERLRLFVQVCQAIQHAHQKGIIHRDIKPSNILVTVNDGVPVPKVIDFGIAKATAGQPLTDRTLFTAFEQFIGTPAYMSPEQTEMTSQDIDTRSDLYSLGVLLYELLTGQTPFDAKELLSQGLDAMRKAIREQEPVRPSTRVRQTQAANRRTGDPSQIAKCELPIDPDLDWIVMKCLEKDRTRRYETANGLAADVERHLNQEPVVARPPSTLYRFQKLVRRNKLAVAASTAVLTSLVLGTVVATWQAVRATRLGNQAVTNEHQARQAQRQAEASDHVLRRLLYGAEMNLAQAAWKENNIKRLRELLDDTANYPDRGFEWYYWQRQTHLELKTFRDHSAAICGVAFSPDGQRVVTGGYDKTAKVWDPVTGRQLLSFNGHVSNINAVAFSPRGDWVVTGSDDATAMVWNANTAKPIRTLTGHSNGISSVAFSPDGRRIVTGSMDQTAKVWDANSGETLVTLKGHSDAIKSVAFSPDGKRIVTGSGYLWEFFGKDYTAKVWDAGTGALLLELAGHNGTVQAVTFSPNGQTILTGSCDRTAKVWDSVTGKELLTLKGHSAPVVSVAISPDGKWIVTGSFDQTAKVWDAGSGEEMLTLKGHSASINSVTFSPDGGRIVTASGDWMAMADHTAKVWKIGTDNNGLTIHVHGPTDGPFVSVAFSPDGQRIVTGIGNGTAKVWDATSAQELITLRGHTAGIGSVAFSPDGHRILTGSSDRTAGVWDVTNGNRLLSLTGHKDEIYTASFFPDGQRLVTGSFDGTVRVWTATNGRELLVIQPHIGRIWSVAVSPDGKRIVTGGDDRRGKVWDARTGKELLTLNGHITIVLAVAFSPDGQRILTGSSDRTAKVWNAVTGEALLSLEGHGDQIFAVGFSPDSRRIITGSADSTTKVWDALNGKEVLTLRDHTGPVRCVFSPDGQRILSGGYDDTARISGAAAAEEVAAWQKEEKDASLATSVPKSDLSGDFSPGQQGSIPGAGDSRLIRKSPTEIHTRESMKP
jgi:WD40 repeat protein/serine/threonine protein kinase